MKLSNSILIRLDSLVMTIVCVLCCVVLCVRAHTFSHKREACFPSAKQPQKKEKREIKDVVAFLHEKNIAKDACLGRDEGKVHVYVH